MKKIIALFLLTQFYCYAQDTIINAKDNLNKIFSENLEQGKVNLFVTDIKTLDTIINEKKAKYKIVYSFSNTCHFSFSAFPDLIDYVNLDKNLFQLFIVISSRFDEIESIKKYFEKLEYYEPVYILDTSIYGNRKNPSVRNELMISKLCKDCNSKKMGFSDLFIRDNNNNIVYHSNYNIPWETIFLEIKSMK